MNIEELKEIINKNEWYRQAVDSRAFYLWTPALAVVAEFKPPVVYHYVNEKFEGHYPKKKFVEQSGEFLRKTRKNKKHIENYHKKFVSILRKFDSIFSKLEKTKIKNNKLLEEYDNLIFEFWKNNFLCDKFDPEGHEMLLKEIAKSKIKLSKDEIYQLTLPAELNFMDYSKLELYKLAKKFEGKKKADKELKKKLGKYAKKYFYLENTYCDIKVLEEKDFLPKLRKIMKKPDRDILRRIKEIENKKKKNNFLSKKIVIEKKIGKELQNVFFLYKRLGEIRDLRKEYGLKSNYYYYLFAKQLSKTHKLDKKYVLRAIPREFYQTKNIEKLKQKLKKRNKAILAVDRKGYELFEGKEAEEGIKLLHDLIIKKYKYIKGVCASKGKVKGTVRIVLGLSHFGKFKKGDILVTHMTRPEHIPLLKKASAIITDEGGVTCHAAIISRELNIPCVIGTKIASKILKDGDKVEIDADKGIIKKIK